MAYFLRSVAFLALLAVPVLAQDPVEGWEGLDASNLSTVYVLDDMDRETTGTLLRLDPESVTLLVNGMERRYEVAKVRRLQKRGDSLKNGAIIGAVIGGVMGALTAGISDCGSGCAGDRVALFLMSTGIYAGVGAGIDALISGRTTLYEASPVGSAFRFGGSDASLVGSPTRGTILRFGFSW